MSIQTITPTILIGEANQILNLQKGDIISVQNLMNTLIKARPTPKMLDEIVVSSLENKTITIHKNVEGQIFRRTYIVNKQQNTLTDIYSKAIQTTDSHYSNYSALIGGLE